MTNVINEKDYSLIEKFWRRLIGDKINYLIQNGGGGVSISRETMADANKTFTAGKNEVYTTITLTAPRALILPLANSFPAGTELTFVDEAGAISATNYVTLTSVGSDLINGSSTQVLNARYGTYKFITDGINKWTLLNITPTTTGTWTPAVVGWTVVTLFNIRYSLTGDQCTISGIIKGVGAGIAASMTGPFNHIAGGAGSAQRSIISITNSTNGTGMMEGIQASNVIALNSAVGGGNWTNGAATAVYLQYTYTIA